MTIKHPLSTMAYAALDWYLPDLKETYENNLKDNFELLKVNGWIDYEPFQYKFNSLGFRSNEILDNNLLALGCSYTFGTGIAYWNTWTFKVAQELKLNCVNCGLPGSSPFTAFRIAFNLIEKIKPKLVLFLCPPNDRMSVSTMTGMYDIGPWVFKDNKKHYKYFSKSAIEYYKDFIMLEENLILHEAISRLAIKQICSNLDIKYIDLYLKDLKVVDLARELKHPGIKSNDDFSKLVLGFI